MARLTGPPPTPNEVLRARGTDGARHRLKNASKVVKIAGTRTPPEPPRPLGEAGRALWERTWSAGCVWLSPESDVEALLLACETLDERVQLRDSVLAEGGWRERSALRVLDKAFLDQMMQLAFTPTSRSRLGVAEVQIEDEIEAFRRAT